MNRDSYFKRNPLLLDDPFKRDHHVDATISVQYKNRTITFKTGANKATGKAHNPHIHDGNGAEYILKNGTKVWVSNDGKEVDIKLKGMEDYVEAKVIKMEIIPKPPLSQNKSHPKISNQPKQAPASHNKNPQNNTIQQVSAKPTQIKQNPIIPTQEITINTKDATIKLTVQAKNASDAQKIQTLVNREHMVDKKPTLTMKNYNPPSSNTTKILQAQSAPSQNKLSSVIQTTTQIIQNLLPQIQKGAPDTISHPLFTSLGKLIGQPSLQKTLLNLQLVFNSPRFTQLSQTIGKPAAINIMMVVKIAESLFKIGQIKIENGFLIIGSSRISLKYLAKLGSFHKIFAFLYFSIKGKNLPQNIQAVLFPNMPVINFQNIANAVKTGQMDVFSLLFASAFYLSTLDEDEKKRLRKREQKKEKEEIY
ncbi:MAG: hypothetical protein HQ564_08180 [Candidatus Saganbacteria bacterium]|nr:hypothetical protein [Candidatus Saganbacteria bacterium]